ncbi:BROMO [Musa troglodytarum]|uniref:BROMO n=1 Tax=Musa troglodytarum TaxID=320322 RepID=A0A9E7H9R3_9LILI|nr:BROMO [Musa troglodytarum]
MESPGHPEGEVWGTWEELLLAFAVNRHGTRSWDSVAMEIQSRSPFSHLLTPQSCRRRYRDLKLRFAGSGGEEGRHDDDEGEEAGSSVEVPWVEELRKLRVAELRRDVERYDASIGYLQLKVKRLEEERERSLRETESVEEKPDQEKEAANSASHTPEAAVGDAISGKDSGHSCGESNSTLPKEGEKKLDGDDGKAEEAVGTGGESADPVERLPAGESGESMVAESKGEEEEEEEEEEEGEKEDSDVQCSRSPSRRRRGRRRRLIPGGRNSREEADADADADAGAAEESIIMGKRVAAESEPFMMFLDTIRSDQQVSILERRLGCQETVRYRSLIRRHVDLEMVRAKVDGLGQGGGSYTTAEFLRDLLLLCTNVIVFHPKDTPESIAAARLRDKVTKEISACVGSPTPSSRPPIEPTPPPTPDLDLTGSLPDKPTTAAPLIACRTRSSTSNMSEEVEEEKEETPKTEPEDSVNEEKALEKKMNKETNVLSRKTRGLRTNKLRSGHAGEGPAAKRPSVAVVPNVKTRPVQNAAVVDAAATSHRKSDGSVASTVALEKQKRQDNSPNQIKRSSKGTVKETLKSLSARGGGVGGKAAEIQRKRGKSNEGRIREPVKGLVPFALNPPRRRWRIQAVRRRGAWGGHRNGQRPHLHSVRGRGRRGIRRPGRRRVRGSEGGSEVS